MEDLLFAHYFDGAYMMGIIKSSIPGLSVFCAWLVPWTAAALRSFATEANGDFIQGFCNKLMPDTSNQMHIEPHSATFSLSAASPQTEGVRFLEFIVLEATNIIAALPGRTDSLLELLRLELPGMYMEPCDGPRSYARVKINMVNMEEEEVAKQTIKRIARARGVRTTIKTIECIFYSPRDWRREMHRFFRLAM